MQVAGSVAYGFDDDGFLTTKIDGTDVTTYDYSSGGELLQVVLPDLTEIEYIHSPTGQRIAKAVDGLITEKYLWSGITTLLATFDGSGVLKARFLYAEGRLPVAMDVGASRFYLAYDQVGSLRAVIDGSGNVVKEIDYDSFGNIIADSNPSFDVPFGFAGGLHDRDTGLVRFGYRDYDPEVGRWTAKDPIGFLAGDTNLYAYVSNVPLSSIDPTGLMEWYDVWIQKAAEGAAGFGDHISFGLTDLFRSMVGWNDAIDKCSGWYAGGTAAGVFFDAATTGGSLALTKSAAKAAAKAANNSRAARKVLGLAKGDLRQAHHVNPLRGHPAIAGGPGSMKTIFPFAGLPSRIRNHRLNLKALTEAEQAVEHARLRVWETAARWLGMGNPGITGGKTIGSGVRLASCDCQ